MQRTLQKGRMVTILLAGMLCIYALAVIFINFSGVPSFYDTDMYMDIYYSMKVWESKSIFPDSWVFGNQLNAVSAPVLASLFYGVTGDPSLSMAIAATLMGLFVILSFDWMLRAVLKSQESRLMAALTLMALVLFCGKAVEGNIGWSMLFTMCSYYSGYTIAAFLAFGAYLRPRFLSDRRGMLMYGLICVLSFGTGIQSIRQTVVMVVPLVMMEGLLTLERLFRKGWKNCLNRESLIVVAGITVSNLLGLIYVRLIEINQVEILGSIELNSLTKLPGEIKNAIIGICALVLNESPDSLGIMACVGAVCLVSVWMILKNTREEGRSGFVLLVLLTASVLVIAAIDVLTAMIFASRYYFMIFPLMGYLLACCFEYGNKPVKWILLCLTLMLAVYAGVKELTTPIGQILYDTSDNYTEVSDYLLEEGCPVVFAEWDHGEKVAIASGGKVTVSFWLDQDRPFVPVEYLSDPAVVASDPKECVYYFEGKKAVGFAQEAARSMGVSLELLKHFPESDIYLYTAPVNLMLLVQ